jgi:hypothetical protein
MTMTESIRRKTATYLALPAPLRLATRHDGCTSARARLTVQPRMWSQWQVGGVGYLSTVQSWQGEEMRGYVGMETFVRCQ